MSTLAPGLEVIRADRTTAAPESSQISKALIGEDPPAEKIESGHADNGHDCPDRGTNKTRYFKKFAHYIPPTDACMILIVVSRLAGCLMQQQDGIKAQSLSAEAPLTTSTEHNVRAAVFISSSRGESTLWLPKSRLAKP